MTTTANWYHCRVKPISRSAGRSVVAAAAYRLGEKLHCEQTQITHDYSRRTGVETSFTIAPSNAPEWATNPQQLWNAAEQTEKRSNSQTAREVELALPSEISKEQREQIARDFANHLVERYGVAVTVALHEPSRHGDDRNYHAHVLMTTRRIDEDGLGKKTRELDDRKTGGVEVLHIREYAADLINQALEQAGSDERIDHRSFKDRGIEQLPTERLSLEQIALERKGEPTQAGDRNRQVKESNQAITDLIEQLDRQIAEASQEPINEEKSTYWQDKVKTDDKDSNDGGTRPAPDIDAMLAKLEAYRMAQSPFNSPVVLAHSKQIKEQGEIQHHGLAMSWVDYAANLMQELSEDITTIFKDEVATLWQSYIKKERDIGRNPDKDGIDFDR